MKKMRSQRGEDEALLVGRIAFSRTRVAIGTPVRMMVLPSVVRKLSLREPSVSRPFVGTGGFGFRGSVSPLLQTRLVGLAVGRASPDIRPGWR